ncbi:hypothetical protein DFH08DRAFT_841300 [Mycena albidolilacea]|uniref:SAP domain-containing protein n=1 Tax=Mycena albidolilacea TaxID=1033008 RepID=A0AAD7F2N9_9AGAR|nr:hypothetical protein DFH08DRAFT_841300 [Mycena albidolilacea]
MANLSQIRSSQVAAAAEPDTLIFPAKEGGNEVRSLKGKTKAQLKAMCLDYGLHVSGNMTTLRTRLQTLSEKFRNDPASCDLTPVKHHAHKGPRDGPQKTHPKQSANRRAGIIDTERITERSKDTRTANEIQELLHWAERTVARLPYKPPKADITSPQTPSVPVSF